MKHKKCILLLFAVSLYILAIMDKLLGSSTVIVKQLIFTVEQGVEQSKPYIDPRCVCPGNGTDPNSSAKQENFCHVPRDWASRQNVTRRKFDCSFLKYLEKVGLTDQQIEKLPTRIPDDELLNRAKMVFVTGFDGSHFYESLTNIGTTQHYFPNSTIIVFDLGLDDDQIQNLKSFCNVQYRKLDFSQYPDYVSKLRQYRFKPMLIAEVFTELKFFWWMDTSVKWVKEDISPLYDVILNRSVDTGTVLLDYAGPSIYATVQPEMYEYFDVQEEKLKKIVQYGASLYFMTRVQSSAKVVKWLFLCSLEIGCLAPEGAQLGCGFNGEYYERYANCHRYDQSALNIILASMYDYNLDKYAKFQNFAMIWRDGRGNYSAQSC